MVHTPRFLNVRIEKVFDNADAAREEGFTEPTHYNNPEYDILGKTTKINHMIFAAVKL